MPSIRTRPLSGHVEPLNEFGERALARTRRPDDADHLPGRHIEGDVVQDFRSVDAIAEGDVIERDVAADRRQPRARGRIGRLGGGVEDVAQPRDRQPRLMKVLPDLRKPQHRRAHPAGQHVEGHQLADRRAAVDDQLGTEIEDAAVTILLTSCTTWLAVLPRLQHPEARGDIAGELLFPAPLHLRLDRHGLERLDPGHALDQERLVLGAASEFLVQPPAEQRRRRPLRSRCRTETSRSRSRSAAASRRTSPPGRRR